MHCLLSACSADAAFQQWAEDWEAMPQSSYPAMAYEEIPTAADLQNAIHQYQTLAQAFRRIHTERLSAENQQLWRRYAVALDEALVARTKLVNDPAAFSIGPSLVPLLTSDSLPAAERLRLLEQCFDHTFAYYETAKQLLQRPDPDRTLLAIQQQLFVLRLLRPSIAEALEQLDEATLQSMEQKKQRARLVVKDYLAFCESLHFEHSDTTLVRELMNR